VTAELERAIELARQVIAPMPTPARVEETRTALLAAAFADKPMGATRPRRTVWVAVAAAAAIVLAIVVTRSEVTDHDTHRHGTVRVRSNASLAAASWAPDEIVVLHDGTIDVEVAPLHAGERFRVIVGDAEIEVRGTAFIVIAQAGRLIDVVVQDGVVEVRSRDRRRMLTAGQSWREPARAITASAPEPVVVPTPIALHVPELVAPDGSASRNPATPEVAPNPIASRVARTTPKVRAHGEPSKPQRVPEELAYDDGWAAMRSGRFTQAASAFARVQLLAPTGPLAEDAGFWYAVALARSGQPTLAGNAFRDYLDAFPTSRRVGEASAMLGWILVDAGKAREAEQRFRVASTDLDPKIRASATAGLETVAKMK
jgi:hypothetical protein